MIGTSRRPLAGINGSDMKKTMAPPMSELRGAAAMRFKE
jgi:hypothetical protein